jgi:hypothetical protein
LRGNSRKPCSCQSPPLKRVVSNKGWNRI